MFSRRAILAGGAASVFFGRPSFAQDEDAYWEAVLQEAYAFKTNEITTLGATPLPASDPLWKEARDVLRATPTTGRPYDVALALDKTVPNKFRAEWSGPSANPLIVLLYVATKTKPSGDVTPWCGAFVSWCVERAGLPSKHSASSQDYRKFGTEVWRKGTPLPAGAKAGDLCVFTRKSDPSAGHVTFFQSNPNDSTVACLGGNQHDSIKSSNFSIGSDLELVTIRRI